MPAAMGLFHDGRGAEWAMDSSTLINFPRVPFGTFKTIYPDWVTGNNLLKNCAINIPFCLDFSAGIEQLIL
jgi:hypothetical protein